METLAPRSLRALLSLCVPLALLSPDAASALSMTSDVSLWTPIDYAPTSTPDPPDDVTIMEADLVGGSEPTFYSAFDTFGTPSTADDVIGFRVRVSGDQGSAGFARVVLIGIDADLDGALDLFLGVDNQGNPDVLSIWNPGPDSNDSPDTTSLVATGLTYAETSANYDWSPVSVLDASMTGSSDPRADLDGTGSGEDHFLTFAFGFDVIAGLLGITASTPLSYVLATSNQPNALNEDLGGVGAGYDASLPFSSLGVLSEPAAPVAEPALAVLVASSLLAGLLARPRAPRTGQ